MRRCRDTCIALRMCIIVGYPHSIFGEAILCSDDCVVMVPFEVF